MSEHGQDRYEKEVGERWGDTEAYRESSRRTSGYAPADWQKINAELEEIEAALAQALANGEAPDGLRAMDLAEAARLHIDRWYYPCSHAMHVGLADMYTADPRFEGHYEDRAEGLAAFVSAAIKANAARG
ncbi:MAG: TipAS antibiotic-recognition domain-containing protein [Gemmatimonadota bacterium]|jgi:hypothetical protein